MATDKAAADGRLTLVLGGARSGKSRYAQTLAMAMPPPWIFIATAQARDDEMGRGSRRIGARAGKAG